MADDIDIANKHSEQYNAALAASVADAAASIPIGAPGECEECEEQRPRLVGGLCAWCRDGRDPPN